MTSSMPLSFQPNVHQFDELQGEVKTKIFSLLSPLERQMIRQVSPLWKEIIDEEFGIKLKVNNCTSDILSSSTEYAVELELNSLTVPVNMTYTSKLKTLTFHNIVVTYNLLPLLRNFASSLEHLNFFQIILDLPEQLQIFATSASQHIRLPVLKTMEIQEWNFSDSLVALLDFLNAGVSFGGLSSVSLFLHNPTMLPLNLLFMGDISNAPAFIQLIKKNERTIETLKYGRQNNMIKLKFHPYDARQSNPLQLQEFICNPQFKMDWLPIFPLQNRLVKIHVGDCRVGMWDGFRAAIRDNCETLETFWISGQSFNQRFDCGIFGNCTKLRKLCVQLYMSPKTHLCLLPSTLTHLNISGSIKRDELERLTAILVNIVEAEFTHLGINQAADAPEDRMGLDLFKRYIRLPKLVKISFLHCEWQEDDWGDMVLWCSTNTSKGIFFEQLFYPMHGQPIRHGIMVTVLPNFDRSQVEVVNGGIDAELHPRLRRTGSMKDFCHTIFSTLTFGYL